MNHQDILDELETKNKEKRFSILSLIISLLGCGLWVFLFMSMPSTFRAQDGLPHPPIFAIVSIYICTLASVMLTILSFIKKEPSSWFKWIGALLSIALFMFIVGIIVFARIVS